MKKLQRIFGGISLLALVFSCSKEKDFQPAVPDGGKTVVTITASAESSTKAVLTEDEGSLAIHWSTGDAISLLEADVNHKFTESGLKDDGASASFSHEGEIGQQAYYALYPYDASATFADGVITTTLPSEQTAVAGSFAPEASLALAHADWGRSFDFLNAVAWAKVSFKTSDAEARITKITVRSIDESVPLSGKVTLTPTLNADGSLSSVTLKVTDGVPYASVVAPAGSVLAPETDYYISVAPTKLTSGYRVELTTEDGLTFSKDYAFGEAQFKRNTIAPVGRKNLDNYEISGYFRVREPNPGVGSYLVVYKMPDGSYRILNEDKTDTYIVKGTHFELSGLKMAFDPSYKKEQMEGMVAYIFRNAWIPSTDSAVTFADDELILSSGTPVEVGSYVYGGTYSQKTYYYANVTLYNRIDNTNVKLTLDQLALNLSDAAGTITGKFNKRTSAQNAEGNPNSCSDLVAALLLHAGDFSGFRSTVESSALEALKGSDNAFTGGFTTASHTSKNGVVSQNHFMIKTEDLLSGAQIDNIWVYKWDTHTYAQYCNNK